MGGQWSALPPEINAGQLMLGDQGASIEAAAIAYDVLAAALMAEAAQMLGTTSSAAADGFIGAGGTAMMATAIPYIAALEALAAWVEQSAASAAAILQAYLTAKAAMVQVPVCDTNRVSQAGAVATNIIGQNTPIILALDMEYFDLFWPTNASNMGGYEGIVTMICAQLGIPPPPAPMTTNPAGFAAQAASVGAAAADGGAHAAMTASSNTISQASGTVGGAAGTPSNAMSSVSPMMSQLGQLPQMLGQLPQMLGQFPQMLGQFPQMAMGMLGPLTQGMNSGAMNAGVDGLAGTGPTALAATTNAVGTGVGGAGSGIGSLGNAGAVMSSFTRPTGSFNAPGAPKLPTGWTPVSSQVPEIANSAQPSTAGSGGGGLYGSPAAAGAAGHMGRDERGKESSAEGRTMQLTVGPRSGRED
jgi:PPE-repeat protein